jgi:GNAT superfamily N-acetyltransferase
MVRPATAADRPAMVATLAAAFASDPPLSFLVPEPARRERLLRIHFAAAIPRYQAWVSEEPAGAALWLPPGGHPVGLADQLRVLPAQVRVFGRHVRRAIGAQRAVERHHPREPHWYLDYIAVAPGGQGRGAGSALLAPVLERADAERMPAYLNAGSPRSRDLYLRHGFEVVSELRLPFGGPPLWRMWRSATRPR